MGSPDTAAKVNIDGFGELSRAPDASAPLIVVFGGVWVKGRGRSGVYMWNYMKPIEPRFHIFVANDNFVDGPKAYKGLTDKLKPLDLTPSQQILYLFSGGYLPGMNLLKTPDGPALFSSIFLVDIWIGGNKEVIKFYKGLADAKAAKITYVYTTFGANNDEARKHIAKLVGSPRAIEVGGTDMDAHLSTNTMAVSKLQ